MVILHLNIKNIWASREVCSKAEPAGAQPFPGNAEHLQSPPSRTGAISKGSQQAGLELHRVKTDIV